MVRPMIAVRESHYKQILIVCIVVHLSRGYCYSVASDNVGRGKCKGKTVLIEERVKKGRPRMDGHS